MLVLIAVLLYFALSILITWVYIYDLYFVTLDERINWHRQLKRHREQVSVWRIMLDVILMFFFWFPMLTSVAVEDWWESRK